MSMLEVEKVNAYYGQIHALKDVSITVDTLTLGWHTITLEVQNPDEATGSDTVVMGICSWGSPDTFDVDVEGAGWNVYGDAYWDPGGWLEMTGLYQSRKGAIFNVVDLVEPGDVSISFDIYTGPNDATGADGFAMSIIDAADPTALAAIVAAAAAGGGLGYGVSGGAGPPGSCLWGSMDIDAFHVEFDTWQNIENGVECHTDPTAGDHIAVTLDGNPADHLLWADLGDIEDSAWHVVTVEIAGSGILITLDGTPIIDDDISGFTFKGGYIGFTGVTGYYSNYHRFDNLHLLEECIVPV